MNKTEEQLKSIIKYSTIDSFSKDLRDLLGHPVRQTNKEMIFKGYRVHWDNGVREYEVI